MKLIFATTLVAAATAQNCPATSGWTINCQTITNPDGQPGPAFTGIQKSGSMYNVFWSSFARDFGGILGSGPFGDQGDGDFCSQAGNSTVTIVDNGIFGWPNEVAAVPSEVFGDGYIHVPDGFATPGTYDGCVAVVNTNGKLPVGKEGMQFITSGCGNGGALSTKYYYHYVKWMDMDGDGDLDMVSARASSRLDPTASDDTGLVWFQNPGKAFSATAKTWKEFEIAAAHNIADTAFDLMTFTDGRIYGVTGGFISGSLVLLSGDDWTDESNIKSSLIASGEQFYFDTKFVDLNLDGIPDVLVTIGSYGVSEGKMRIYPGMVNADGSYAVGSNITVYDQFPVWNSASLGSPGSAFLFNYSDHNVKKGVVPSILVSGDDDGYMYMFDPVSDDADDFNWTYNMDVIFKTDNFNPFITIANAPTVGQPSIVDLDGNGCYEIVIPSYAEEQMIYIEQRTQINCN